MQQPLLPGTKAERKELHNLFFALQPDAITRGQMAAAANALKARDRAAGRWIRPERYHLTLRFLRSGGAIPDEMIRFLCDAASRVHVERFTLTIDRIGSFRNRSIPWWLGTSDASDVQRLHDDLDIALRDSGARVEDADLKPHVTILRDAAHVLAPESIPPIAWPIEAFVLVDSLIIPRAEHRILGRWRLR